MSARTPRRWPPLSAVSCYTPPNDAEVNVSALVKPTLLPGPLALPLGRATALRLQTPLCIPFRRDGIMQNRGRVHRFCDHAVAGVNWRPTRFVDEVPSSRVCGLCRMIPNRILVQPCGHLLCQSCHAASSHDGGRRCPLDQELFEEAECVSYDLPPRKANALKVYCWNESHGCEFQASMEDMLLHFENECAFHSLECLRCGESVLHRELSTHYVSGCSTSVSSARAENPSSESRALTLQDVRNALEEVKALLREPNHEQTLPAIQSQMNELKEQVRSQESRLAEITREAGAAANPETAQHATTASPTVMQEPTTRRSPGDEASTSLSGPCSPERISEKPEIFSNLPVDVLKGMRKTSAQDYPQHAIEYPCLRASSVCHLSLTSELSTTRTWRDVLGSVKYVLDIDSSKKIYSSHPTSYTIRVLHTMDSCFTVKVYIIRIAGHRKLCVNFDFLGILVGSQLSAPRISVLTMNESREFACSLPHHKNPCRCNDVGDSRVCWHGTFMGTTNDFSVTRWAREEKLKLEIDLERDG